MEKKLGIYVTADHDMENLLCLCRAARKKGVKVAVFLTHLGTRLTQNPRFSELTGLADVALCRVGFEANGLAAPPEGLGTAAMASQSWHAEMIYDCDRYITF